MSKAGKAGRAASPWNNAPHCNTPKALRLFNQAKKKREAEETREQAERVADSLGEGYEVRGFDDEGET